MLQFFQKLLDTSDFPARWYCGKWSAGLGWLHILSDLAIFFAYMAIPLTILYFMRQRKDLILPRIGWLFAAFIFFCGTVHLIEALIFWMPVYRLSGLLKGLTGVVSMATVVALIPIVPKALLAPGLESVNEQLRLQIQEREAIEAQLRESEERFRVTFEQAAVGISHVGPDGSWLRVNQRLCDIVGYTREELLGTTFQDITHPDDLDADLTYVQQVIDGEIKTYSMEKRYIQKDGSFIWINLTVSLVRDPQGEPRYFISVVEDIGQRKAAEEELARHAEEMTQLNEQLAQANRELDSFAYIASHDLQEPLRTLVSFSSLLEQDLGDTPLSTDAQEDLRFIQSAARDMQGLISSLLKLSRIGRDAIEFEQVDLNEQARFAVAHLEASIEQRQAQVEIGPLPTVEGDPALLRQLFQNLIGNSVKFCEKQPHIEIFAERDGPHWVVSVKDNGIGIDPAHFSSLFEPFRRLHGKAQYEGHGIGLAMCQKVVELHRGTLWVESAPGKGACFRFTLKAPQQEPTP